jgi:hypothetical protein
MDIGKELLSIDTRIIGVSITPGRQGDNMGKDRPGGGSQPFHSGWSFANPRAMERYGIVGGA